MFRTWTTSALVTGRILNLVRLFWYCMFKWNSLVLVSGPYTPALDTLLFTPTIVIIHTSVGHTVNYNYHCNNTHNIYTPLTWSQTTQSIPSANYLQQFYLILKKKQKKTALGSPWRYIFSSPLGDVINKVLQLFTNRQKDETHYNALFWLNYVSMQFPSVL